MKPLRVTPILIAVALLGCQGDSEPPSDEAPQTMPQCDEVDFAPTAFSGPGFNDDGLIAPVQDSYMIGTTAVVINPEQETRFFKLSGAVFATIADFDGFIGFSVGTSTVCGTARTLTAWRDEEAMFKFVVSDVHSAAMAETQLVTTVGATTHYTAGAAEFPPSWQVAKEQVGKAEVLY